MDPLDPVPQDDESAQVVTRQREAGAVTQPMTPDRVPRVRQVHVGPGEDRAPSGPEAVVTANPDVARAGGPSAHRPVIVPAREPSGASAGSAATHVAVITSTVVGDASIVKAVRSVGGVHGRSPPGSPAAAGAGWKRGQDGRAADPQQGIPRRRVCRFPGGGWVRGERGGRAGGARPLPARRRPAACARPRCAVPAGGPFGVFYGRRRAVVPPIVHRGRKGCGGGEFRGVPAPAGCAPRVAGGRRSWAAATRSGSRAACPVQRAAAPRQWFPAASGAC